MKTKKNLLYWLPREPIPIASILAVFLAVVEVFIDLIIRLDFDIAIIYIMPLILAATARSRRVLWGLALFLIGMTFIVYAIQIKPGGFSLQEPSFINRVMASVTMLFTTGLLHVYTLALDHMAEQARSLKLQNETITQQNEELEHRRQEAEEASNRKTRLLASVSHDMRSPLIAMNLTAQVIRRTADKPAFATEVPSLAQRIQANASALTDLVSDIFDISCIDSGQIELHENEFQLNELLTEEHDCLLPLAQAKNLTFTVALMSPPIWIQTDRSKLTRILNNLVTNAIKFTEQGSVILSASLTPDLAVLIRVRDTGIGIAPENLERIFDEFAPLRRLEHDRSKGSGLGLVICHRLVSLIGGTISVESQINYGSVFSVCLPPQCVLNKSLSNFGFL